MLKQIYLSNMRQRFKNEVNRLTSGGMEKMLVDQKDAKDLSFLLSYVTIFHWLQHNVSPQYLAEMLTAFKGGTRAFLMDLLEQSSDATIFTRGYINYCLLESTTETAQKAQVLNLLATQNNDAEQLVSYIVQIWKSLHLFEVKHKVAYAQLAKQERQRYQQMLAEDDKQRLQLVDDLPGTESTQQFHKLGVIPAMGCPQTCRHCMFIFRPLVKDYPDPGALFKQLGTLTSNLLFTGGDLTNHLDHFYRAIREIKQVSQFAILLNGDFANDLSATHEVLKSMSQAVRKRPRHWQQASVLLQISFDDFHQEVYVNKKGDLQERIPVAKIANIVEAVPRYREIQLCLLHKQTRLNFSMDVLQKGVFSRLTQELGQRGHQVQVLSTAPSSRHKRDPLNSQQKLPVLKDASFVLSKYPDSPVLLTSSTIDAYGRASLLDDSETLKDKDLLQQVLQAQQSTEAQFDTDLMFWFNGWVTAFSAVHISLGNLYEEGMDIILSRHAKDPLLAALRQFDRRLVDYYSERENDLDKLIANATGPHHLFHLLTESAEMRLYMTQRLLLE